ncbi:MAG: precorrin-3B C(17)-methyltransferase [Pseudomonadota bacterium]
MELNPAIVALTASGAGLARTIKTCLPAAEIHGLAGRVDGADVTFDDTVGHLQMLFRAGRPVVGVCAAGILVRALGPVLGDKRAEPAVLAVDDGGSVVVPLLGGHQARANELSRHLAAHLGATAAVTTASDARFGVALDTPPAGYHLRNPQHLKSFVAALLAGAGVAIELAPGVNADWLVSAGLPLVDDSKVGREGPGEVLRIVVTTTDEPGDPHTLVYHPALLALGVGCERNTPAHELEQHVVEALRARQLAPDAVAGVFSLDVKADEPAVQALAEALSAPARFFASARLEQETPRLKHPSEIVFREVGCHGVAEAAALAAAGENGQLVVEKRKGRRVTCAVAVSDTPIDPSALGRARGSLAVVGIGPGASATRSPAAAEAIADADHIVGYAMYVDLAADLLRDNQIQHRYSLGKEAERVQHAIDLATAGRRVALVCSGDAGVYAMASLACELLDDAANAAASRIAVAVYPGISAMQAAAAAVGAPLGHDFCAISLSDLLTPREVIERRLDAAGSGDFVMALYNPISATRVATFERALEIIREHRGPDTIVVVARSLGRPDESTRVMELGALSSADVDMLFVVLVGSSNTRRFDHAGRTLAYTPRGYLNPAAIRP